MPFKGDRRLGGPHDNERTLNGTSSDFDSFPAYGTVISTSNGYYGNGVYVDSNTYYPATADYVVRADGLGGEYQTAENVVYISANTFFGSALVSPPYSNTSSQVFVGVNGIGWLNNQYYTSLGYYWDGTGGYYTSQEGLNYYPFGQTISEYSQNNYASYTDSNMQYVTLPNGTVSNYVVAWDGNGGYSVNNVSTSGNLYPYGTYISGSASMTYNSTWVGGLGNVSNGTWNDPAANVWDGMGNIATTSISGGQYYSYGTWIGSWYDNDMMTNYNYYWDGMGGFYYYN